MIKYSRTFNVLEKQEQVNKYIWWKNFAVHVDNDNTKTSYSNLIFLNNY